MTKYTIRDANEGTVYVLLRKGLESSSYAKQLTGVDVFNTLIDAQDRFDSALHYGIMSLDATKVLYDTEDYTLGFWNGSVLG